MLDIYILVPLATRANAQLLLMRGPVHTNFMAYFYGHFRFVNMSKAEVGRKKKSREAQLCYVWFLFEKYRNWFDALFVQKVSLLEEKK